MAESGFTTFNTKLSFVLKKSFWDKNKNRKLIALELHFAI